MYELCEVDVGIPTEPRAGLRRIADQLVQFSPATLERRIDTDVLLPVEPDVRERALDELAHGMALPGCNDVVAGLVLLQHQPHRLHVVAGIPPVATGIEIAQDELLLEAQRDRRRSLSNLPREKLERPARRLVVVQDPGAGEQAIAMSIRAHAEVRVRLGNAVRRQRRKRRLLRLWNVARLPEDLRGGRLVEANAVIDGADGL